MSVTTSTNLSSNDTSPSNPQWFRQVMGRYPTGVVLISTAEADGTPVGMVVGTFTSVSLDPPLIAFLPGKTSTSWPRIRKAGRFAVNVLGADQPNVCRAFSGRGGKKFEEVTWHLTESGMPVLDEAVFWLECEVADVYDAGDHEIVMGRVDRMDLATADLPLLFFQGGYGRFTAAVAPDLSPQLRFVDRARPYLDRLVRELDCDCLVGSRAEDEFVILGSASSGNGEWVSSLVGQRVPAVAPFGRTEMAWSAAADQQRWIAASQTVSKEEGQELIERIRERGFSVSVESDTPPLKTDEESLHLVMDPGVEAQSLGSGERIHSISAPVLDSSGIAVLVLSLYGIPDDLDEEGVKRYASALLDTTTAISDAIAS